MKLMKLIGDGEQASLIHLSDEQLMECHQNMIRVLAFRAEVVSCVVCLPLWVKYFRNFN